MSLCNIWIEENRALVAVDTIGFADGKSVEASKIFAIPHASVVFAYRGQRIFFVNILLHSMLLDGADSFDLLSDRLPELIERFVDAIRRDAPADRLQEMGCELAMVGWSDRSVCMRGITYIFRNVDQACEVRPMESNVRIAPGVPHVPDLDTASAMLELARRQIKYAQEFHPESPPMGGRLIVAEVKREAISIVNIGTI